MGLLLFLIGCVAFTLYVFAVGARLMRDMRDQAYAEAADAELARASAKAVREAG
jgi:hypothetical protein